MFSYYACFFALERSFRCWITFRAVFYLRNTFFSFSPSPPPPVCLRGFCCCCYHCIPLFPLLLRPDHCMAIKGVGTASVTSATASIAAPVSAPPPTPAPAPAKHQHRPRMNSGSSFSGEKGGVRRFCFNAWMVESCSRQK